MLPKLSIQRFVILLALAALVAIPASVQAGGTCGPTYIVQWGDTLDKIAGICGTTVSALYAANPGISGYLYAGQVLVIPGATTTYCNCAYSAYQCNCPPVTYTNTYIVQPGDTFAMIASRYGVSVNTLWAANPQIWNINYIYPGQVIYVPGSSWFVIVPTPAPELVPLSYGVVPAGTPQEKVTLANKANAEVYVSLQGTTKDGFKTIHEYPVEGLMHVKVPSGFYIYVAWVGGHKFSGQFNLNENRTISFYSSQVVVE